MSASVSWYGEFRRLFDCIPCVEVQTLREHSDQVLHLAFSHKGHQFSSCSKDCTVKVDVPPGCFWLTGFILLTHNQSVERVFGNCFHRVPIFVGTSCSCGTQNAQMATSLWCTARACGSSTGPTPSSPSSTRTTPCCWCLGSTLAPTTRLQGKSPSSVLVGEAKSKSKRWFFNTIRFQRVCF